MALYCGKYDSRGCQEDIWLAVCILLEISKLFPDAVITVLSEEFGDVFLVEAAELVEEDDSIGDPEAMKGRVFLRGGVIHCVPPHTIRSDIVSSIDVTNSSAPPKRMISKAELFDVLETIGTREEYQLLARMHITNAVVAKIDSVFSKFVAGQLRHMCVFELPRGAAEVVAYDSSVVTHALVVLHQSLGNLVRGSSLHRAVDAVLREAVDRLDGKSLPLKPKENSAVHSLDQWKAYPPQPSPSHSGSVLCCVSVPRYAVLLASMISFPNYNALTQHSDAVRLGVKILAGLEILRFEDYCGFRSLERFVVSRRKASNSAPLWVFPRETFAGDDINSWIAMNATSNSAPQEKNESGEKSRIDALDSCFLNDDDGDDTNESTDEEEEEGEEGDGYDVNCEFGVDSDGSDEEEEATSFLDECTKDEREAFEALQELVDHSHLSGSDMEEFLSSPILRSQLHSL